MNADTAPTAKFAVGDRIAYSISIDGTDSEGREGATVSAVRANRYGFSCQLTWDDSFDDHGAWYGEGELTPENATTTATGR